MFAPTLTTTRRFLMVLGTLGLAAAVWTPARADAHPEPPTPVTGRLTFSSPGSTFGDLCSFPGTIDLHGKGATIQLPNGTLIATSPALTATVTNTDTGAHVDLNIPGP